MALDRRFLGVEKVDDLENIIIFVFYMQNFTALFVPIQVGISHSIEF